MKICAIEPAGQQYGSELALLDILVGLDRGRFASEVILPKGCSFRDRLVDSKIPFLEYLRINLQTGRNVRRAVSYVQIMLHWFVNRPDVILVNQAGILRGIALCNFIFCKPIVCLVTTLEDAAHVSRLPAWVIKHVHKLVCNSEFTASNLNSDSLGGSSAAVSTLDIKQVVYCSYFPKNLFSERPTWDLSNNAHKFVIGILGRICKSKGHDVLLNALVYLNEIDSNWLRRIEVVFIGDYSQQERDSMRQLIAESPIDIEVTGFRTDIAPELARLHLLLIPSVAEPFGRVVQEAADAGLPVIASDSGGLGEICQRYNYGTIFHCPDAVNLAELIVHAIEHYDQVVAESLANRERFLEEFSYQKIMSEIEQILMRACESRQ